MDRIRDAAAARGRNEGGEAGDNVTLLRHVDCRVAQVGTDWEGNSTENRSHNSESTGRSHGTENLRIRLLVTVRNEGETLVLFRID